MTETQMVHRLPVKSTDDPAFARVARRVEEPERDPGKPTQFFPALATFGIGAGPDVDISLYYSQPSASMIARGRFDRHLHTEEFFVALEGDWYMPMGECRNPDDPEERPRAEDMCIFLVKQGDLFVLRSNVWHTGVWPAGADQPAKFLMILSGHRAGSGLQGRVDHIVMELEDGGAVVPDVQLSRHSLLGVRGESGEEVRMGRVNGKVALITGAGSGMGKATAELFGREGAKVVVANRNEDRGRATVDAIRSAGGEAAFVQYDQSAGEDGIRRMVSEATSAYGRIDILHSHAGALDAQRDGPLHDVSADLLDFYWNLNIKGFMLVVKWVLRHMMERNGGSIVLTSSDTALMGIPGAGSGYTASKSAILGLTRVLAATYAPYNIRVNAIAPGFTYGCQMTDPFPPAVVDQMREGYLIKSLGQPMDAAYAVLYLASDEARFLTGVILPVDGGHSVA